MTAKKKLKAVLILRCKLQVLKGRRIVKIKV